MAIINRPRPARAREVSRATATAPGRAPYAGLRALLYLLALSSASFQMAIVPLLPEYARRFSLSSFEQGILLCATALSTLLVSLPAGALADRLGPRRLTLVAGWVMAAAMALEAFTPTLSGLLLGRLVFGAGYGIVWTAGLAWLAGTSGEGSGLGRTVAASGLGGIIGPLLAGGLAQLFGMPVPFLLGTGIFVALTLGLTAMHSPEATMAPSESGGLLASVPGLVRNRCIVASVVAVVVAGLTWSVAYLVAPEELQAGGVTAGSIGVIIAAASIVYVLGSAGVASIGARAVRARVVFVGTAALAVTFVPVVVSSAPLALTAMLCGSAIVRSVLWTVAYPLAAQGAEERGVGLGMVMGGLQSLWAVVAVLSPLAAGAVAGATSPQLIFALTLLATLGVLSVGVAWVFRRSLRYKARLVLDRAGMTA